MMTYIKYRLFMFALIIFTSTSSFADVTSDTQNKHKIYAHTGQDPRYRSIGFPIDRKPFVDDVWTLTIHEISKEISSNFTDSIDWSVIYDESTTFGIPNDIAVREKPFLQPSGGEFGYPFGSKSTPAPSAIPLLLLGFASLIRRRQ